MQDKITTPEQLEEMYDMKNLLPITSLAQVKFYILHGEQPLLVYPSKKADIMAFWYPKNHTTKRLFTDYRKYINDKYQVGDISGN